jgi:hypothetical protein
MLLIGLTVEGGMLRSKTMLMVSAFAIALARPTGAAFSEQAPLPPPRPADLAPSTTPSPAASPPSLKGPEKADQTCLTQLIASGAGAGPATVQQPIAEGCGISSPVRLDSIALANGDVVGLPDRPILECAFALVFADYVRVIVAPLGAGTLGTKVDSIETGPGYQCRNRNGLPDGKISAHAKGLAIDIVAIRFADKRRVALVHQDGANEASYIRATRAAACGWFTTVLGPGADPFHANHMHLDTESHGSNGSYRICQ